MSKVALPGCVVFAALFCWGAASNPPVRLAISAEKRSVLVGESIPVTVELRDAYNIAASAARIYKVTVEMRSGATVAQTMTADISPPESWTRVVFPARREGIWMIKALNPQLREDSTYVRVRRSVALVASPRELFVPHGGAPRSPSTPHTKSRPRRRPREAHWRSISTIPTRAGKSSPMDGTR